MTRNELDSFLQSYKYKSCDNDNYGANTSMPDFS